MSSRSSKKHKRWTSSGKKITMPPENGIESDDLENGLPTSVSGDSNPDMKSGFNRDGTVAPEIGEDEEKKEQYSQTAAALLDKHLLSGKSIYALFVIVILSISGFIFIQDNNANKLNEWRDIWWSIQKCSFFWLLFVVYLLYQFISWLLKKKNFKVVDRKY